MLSNWQKEFPECFHYHHTHLMNLNENSKTQLSEVLDLLKKNELLSETIVNLLFKDALYSDLGELFNLINTLLPAKLLSLNILPEIFKSNFSAVHESIKSLMQSIFISPEILLFLLSQNDPKACADLIVGMHKAHVDVESMKKYLFHHIQANGISRAMVLFGHSSFDFRLEHLPLFSVFTEVLAIPLCQTIFDARLRGQSDYDIPSDPLDVTLANELMTKLVVLSDEDSKVRIFFNFFARFRPCPASQKYMVELDVAAMVSDALIRDCELKIKNIQNLDDCIALKQWMEKLTSQGGDRDDLDRIKYDVANRIESTDWYSNRHYEQLMEEIFEVLRTPQLSIKDSFDDLLLEIEMAQKIMLDGLNKNGLFAQKQGEQIPPQREDLRMNIS